jgi:hypothetical protein
MGAGTFNAKFPTRLLGFDDDVDIDVQVSYFADEVDGTSLDGVSAAQDYPQYDLKRGDAIDPDGREFHAWVDQVFIDDKQSGEDERAERAIDDFRDDDRESRVESLACELVRKIRSYAR